MKVAIVGPTSRTRSLEIYDNTWEFWGINAAHHFLKWTTWHRHFNLHRYRHLMRDCPQYVAWDGQYSRERPSIPMMVVDAWPKKVLPGQKMFPRESMNQRRRDYHASSFDWVVAYAIHAGAKHIAVHGVNFALDSPRDEPISGRACLEYWLGYAEGLGIRTTTIDCDIFYQYHIVRSRSVYGYDDVINVEKR